MEDETRDNEARTATLLLPELSKILAGTESVSGQLNRSGVTMLHAFTTKYTAS